MKQVIVEPHRYYDSVFLMRISRALEMLPDIDQATVAMGTPANLENLERVGFSLSAEASTPSANDLIIAIESRSADAFVHAREELEVLLAGEAETEGASARPAATLQEAINRDPQTTLALISVPGAYAAREARQALRRGLHVMLFSDNVEVKDEIALKDDAVEKGLLMMGPDCGTAIINHTPLGFANAIRPGRIGIIGASGTGIQEVSSLIDRFGAGISQAIGTGGRDLSEAVAGRMTCFAIRALAEDASTDVIVVVSKAPAPKVAEHVITTLQETDVPAVVHFVGCTDAMDTRGHILFTDTLAETAVVACRLIGRPVPLADEPGQPANLLSLPASGLVHGFFCGGTLCQEAWSLLARDGLDIHSNVAADPAWKVAANETPAGHVVWDLGDDKFTVGRPHPMIEPHLRDNRVAEAGENPQVAVVLADCVIGYGAHDDPAAGLANAAARARETARQSNRDLLVVASITGTDKDPQRYAEQRTCLEEAGVIVAPDNAAAARQALVIVRALEGRAS